MTLKKHLAKIKRHFKAIKLEIKAIEDDKHFDNGDGELFVKISDIEIAISEAEKTINR